MRAPTFKQAIAKPTIPGPETSPWFWNPNNVSVKFGPPDFAKKLEELDPNLKVTWDPIHDNWLLWNRKDSFQSKYCRGWLLLFPVREPDGSYRPLDDRVLARLYQASADKWGSARKYFDAMEREQIRAKEKREKAALQDTIDIAMESFNHSQISISQRGKSSGSKFATYHS